MRSPAAERGPREQRRGRAAPHSRRPSSQHFTVNDHVAPLVVVTFAVFAARAGKLPTAYVRYLINGLRNDFGLVGVPVRVLLRAPENPYADED